MRLFQDFYFLDTIHLLAFGFIVIFVGILAIYFFEWCNLKQNTMCTFFFRNLTEAILHLLQFILCLIHNEIALCTPQSPSILLYIYLIRI